MALVCASVLLPARPAWSCICLAASPVEHADRTDAISTGRVGSVEHGRSSRIAHVDVELVYKGDVADATLVTTASESSACGFEFPEGRLDTIFADAGEGGGLSTNTCTATTQGGIVPPNPVWSLRPCRQRSRRVPSRREVLPEPGQFSSGVRCCWPVRPSFGSVGRRPASELGPAAFEVVALRYAERLNQKLPGGRWEGS